MKNQSTIIDTDTLEVIFEHLTDGAIVLFDLDNTLIEPLQHFGSVQWAEYYEKKLLATGKTPLEVEAHIQSYWNERLPDMSMRLVDESSPELIRRFRLKGHLVMGLTARYHEDAFCTFPQLERLGIEFDRIYEDCALDLPRSAIFDKGVMYASTYNTKSSTLLAFLKRANFKPKKVIFVDDKHHHVKELEEPLTLLDIEYVGIRYSKADKRVQEFNADIADLQMELFPQVISDEDAERMLALN